MMKLEGGFIQNLGRVYGIYTLGFLGFVILMAILEQAGVSADAIGWMFVGFTILIYALIGVLSRTMQSNEYYVAGRQVPATDSAPAAAAVFSAVRLEIFTVIVSSSRVITFKV